MSAIALTLIILGVNTNQSSASPSDESARRPNIVLILADDLGYREVGCFGQEKIRTPNLDRLAAQGMRLTQHYSGNAVCAPSRCVLMTGLDPGHAWVRNNSEVQPEGQKPLPKDQMTIAEMLKAGGYVTGAFGKWGLGAPASEGDPRHQGFDRFYGYNCQRHAHSYYPDYLWDNDRKVPLRNHPPIPGHAKLPDGADPTNPDAYREFRGTDYAPDRIREQALSFISDNAERPFFLYYPSTLPHVALHVPDGDLAPYLKLNWNDPPFTAATGGYTPHFTPRAAYAAMISHLDQEVGAIMDQLEKSGVADRTLVIFSSDNGTTHLDQEVDALFFQSVGELRGLKGSLYEGGIRVPTIVRWPGVTPPGSTSEYISGFEDWMPTIREAINSSIEIQSDGISLVPVLRGEAQEERPFLYREFPAYGGQQMVRKGPWKMVLQQLNQGQISPELYNLANDPSESNNVARQHPEIVQSLTTLAAEHRRKSEEFPLIPFDRPAASARKKNPQ